MAQGRIAPGAAPVELATDSAEIVAELRARGFPIVETVEPILAEPTAPIALEIGLEPEADDMPAAPGMAADDAPAARDMPATGQDQQA